MKTKLIIGLLLLVSGISQGQAPKIELSANIIPSYFSSHHPDILDHHYETSAVREFVLINNIAVDLMITKNLGLQIGLQAYQVQHLNSSLIEYGHHSRLENDRFSVKITTMQYEVPISIILRKSISRKLDLSALIGGSRIVRSRTITTELRNKDSGEIERTKTRVNKYKTMSKFSPQIQFKLQYKLLDRLNINGIVLMKSAQISSLETYYLGAGLGISYVLIK